MEVKLSWTPDSIDHFFDMRAPYESDKDLAVAVGTTVVAISAWRRAHGIRYGVGKWVRQYPGKPGPFATSSRFPYDCLSENIISGLYRGRRYTDVRLAVKRV